MSKYYGKEHKAAREISTILGQYGDDARLLYYVTNCMSNKLRSKIFYRVLTAGPITVTDIYVFCRIEQSVASQHLARLRRAELVNTEREGKYIYYTVNKKIWNAYLKALDSFKKAKSNEHDGNFSNNVVGSSVSRSDLLSGDEEV